MSVYSGEHKGALTLHKGDDVTLLTKVTGYVDVREGATLTAPALINDVFYEIANSGYVLFANSQSCKAGCRGPFSFDDGLAHWARQDVPAVYFTAAILAHKKRIAA